MTIVPWRDFMTKLIDAPAASLVFVDDGDMLVDGERYHMAELSDAERAAFTDADKAVLVRAGEKIRAAHALRTDAVDSPEKGAA